MANVNSNQQVQTTVEVVGTVQTTPAQGTTTPPAAATVVKATAPAVNNTPPSPTAPVVDSVPPSPTVSPAPNTPSVKEELAKLRSTLSPTTETYLSVVEQNAKRLSSGPEGVAMDIPETHRAQAAIFRAIQYLITNTPDAEFNAAMYSLVSIFKDNGQSRVGGLSPERVFGAIGYSEKLKAPNWIAGKTDADREWFCTTVTTLHMAHERGGNAIKNTRTDALISLPAIKNSETGQRYINWLTACKPLNY